MSCLGLAGNIFCIAGFENVLVAGVPATCGER